MGYPDDPRRFINGGRMSPDGYWVIETPGFAQYAEGDISVRARLETPNRPLKDGLKFSVAVEELASPRAFIYHFDVEFTKGIIAEGGNNSHLTFLLEPSKAMLDFFSRHPNIFSDLIDYVGYECKSSIFSFTS